MFLRRILQGENPDQPPFGPDDPGENDEQTFDEYQNSHREFFEFFIFMIPALVYSVYSIRRIYFGPKEKVTPITDIHISYNIKHTLCFYHIITYILSLMLGVVLSPASYWIANYRGYSMMYIFGIASWFFCAKLLEKDVPKGLPQQYITRLFWTSNLGITILKMTFAYEAYPWPILLNVVKCFGDVFLTLYAIAKPFDSDDALKIFTEPNRLPFIRTILEKIEEIEQFQAVFNRRYSIDEPWDINPEEQFIVGKDELHEYIDIAGKANLVFTGDPETWKSFLPPVKCKVVQRMNKDEKSEKFGVIFEIETEVKEDTYYIDQKITQFENLDEYINKVCIPSITPWYEKKPPRLQKVHMTSFNDEKSFVQARLAALEKYLNTIVSEPKYMINETVKFLGIDDPHRSMFVAYNLKGRNLKEQEKKDKENQAKGGKTGAPNKPGSKEIEMVSGVNKPKMKGNTSPKKKKKIEENPTFEIKPKDNHPKFTVKCVGSQPTIYKDQYEYIFHISSLKDGIRDTWTVARNYKDFLSLNESLEKEIGRKIAAFEQYIPKPASQKQSLDQVMLEKRREGFEKYIDFILSDRQNFKPCLFEFLEFYHDRKSSRVSLNDLEKGGKII